MNRIPCTLGQWPYFWWGVGLMGVKYNLDRAVAWLGFRHPWYFWNYLEPHGFAAIDAVPPQDQEFYLVMLLTALPFLGVGLFLTVLRLRSAGYSPLFCLLFFVPVLNLIFFALLCVLPPRQTDPLPLPREDISWWPSSAMGSGLIATVGVSWIGLGLACLSTQVLQNYGWGLYVALPFAMGLVSVLMYARRLRRTWLECLLVSMLPIVFCGIGLLTLGAEGVICLIMAAPIGLVLSSFGGFIGYLIVRSRNPLSPRAMALLLISVPFTMGMEKAADQAPPLLSVTSSVIVKATPEAVWPNVVAFSPIPPERDWILHTGVAYPTSARIDGQGVGAIRHCIFTTGEFVEPVTIWDEHRLLAFSVSAQPEPMVELTPYPRLRTPHLQGYLQSQRGEIRLTPLPGGRTLLEGTTWYMDRIWPVAYWQLWSDLLIHSIHLRVLNHIKNLSEQEAKRSAS